MSAEQTAWLTGAEAERKRCETIAERAAWIPSDCDHLGHTDPETGARECSIEIRGDTCPCSERAEAAEHIRDAIRALPPPTPPGDQRQAADRVAQLEQALRDLEQANEALCAARPQPIYEAMIAARLGHLMINLDRARTRARAVLAPPAPEPSHG